MADLKDFTMSGTTYTFMDSTSRTKIADLEAIVPESAVAPDLLYKAIMGDDSDWSLQQVGNAYVTKKGLQFTFTKDGGTGSTYKYVNLTGTTHTVRSGSEGTVVNALADTDYVSVSNVTNLAPFLPVGWAHDYLVLGFRVYCTMTSLTSSTSNNTIYLRFNFRRQVTVIDPDTQEETTSYESSGWVTPIAIDFLGMQNKTIVQNGTIFTSMYQISTVPIEKCFTEYEEVAIMLERHSQSVAGTVIIEPYVTAMQTNVDGFVDKKLEGVNWLVNYGMRSVFQTITRDGLTCTTYGNRVTLDGTNGNASTLRFRLFNELSTKAGSISAGVNTSSGCFMKAGHRYRFCARLISGKYTQAGDTAWFVNAYKAGATSGVTQYNYNDGVVAYRDAYVTTDTEFCFWLCCYSGDKFENAVFEAWVEELTDNPNVECDITVSGTDPVITARQNKRYMCGTASTLSFTPCPVGSCEVIFTSGASQTVLSGVSGVIWPDWFDPTALEANRIYDIIITDATYGLVTTWAAPTD